MTLNVDATRLPEYVERGAKGGPKFDTTVLSAVNGVEQRNINRPQSRGEWTIGYGMRTASDWEPVLSLHYAQRGRAYGFMFRDWSDDNVTDGSIGTGDGVTHEFQLVKTYDVGVRQYVRTILVPDTTTLVVKVAGTPTTEFTTDDGMLILWTAPGVGESVSATFDFFVPVRFADDHIEINIEMATTDQELAAIPAVPLIEILASSTRTAWRYINGEQTISDFTQVATATVTP